MTQQSRIILSNSHLQAKQLLVVESGPSFSDHVKMRIWMKTRFVVSFLADIIALVKCSMKKIRFSVATTDQLVLEPRVQVDEVPGVLPSIVHHFGRKWPTKEMIKFFVLHECKITSN